MGNLPPSPSPSQTFPLPESVITAILNNPSSGTNTQGDVIYIWRQNMLYLYSTNGTLSLATYQYRISPSSAGTSGCFDLSLTFVPTVLQTDVLNPHLYPNRCSNQEGLGSTLPGSSPPNDISVPSGWTYIGDFCLKTVLYAVIYFYVSMSMYRKPDGNYVSFFKSVHTTAPGHDDCVYPTSYLNSQTFLYPSNYIIVETDSNGNFIGFVNPTDYSLIDNAGYIPVFGLTPPKSAQVCADNTYQVGFDLSSPPISLNSSNIYMNTIIRGCRYPNNVFGIYPLNFSIVDKQYCSCSSAASKITISSH